MSPGSETKIAVQMLSPQSNVGLSSGSSPRSRDCVRQGRVLTPRSPRRVSKLADSDETEQVPTVGSTPMEAPSPPLSPFSISASNGCESQGALSRRFSSPELILLAPPLPCYRSRFHGSFKSDASSLLSQLPSTAPSPLPNGDLLPTLPPTIYRRSRKGDVATRLDRFSMESLPTSSPSSNFHYDTTASITPIQQQRGSPLLQRPQVRVNGSLLSIGNAQLLESASKLMEQYSPSPHHHKQQTAGGGTTANGAIKSRRRSSVGSNHGSECSLQSKLNLQLLQNVGRTIQRTHSQLKKTRFFHAFYLLALPVYTLLGALVFQALDGAHDDHLMSLYEQRCQEDRDERVEMIRSLGCENGSAVEKCFQEMLRYLNEVEVCYRRWHAVNKTMTHPMSSFTNAVIYAFSVYTTIGWFQLFIMAMSRKVAEMFHPGYGTISASTTAARVATVIYGILGIPLFFAFIKEEGNQCRTSFIWLYKRLMEGVGGSGRGRYARCLRTMQGDGGERNFLKPPYLPRHLGRTPTTAVTASTEREAEAGGRAVMSPWRSRFSWRRRPESLSRCRARVVGELEGSALVGESKKRRPVSPSTSSANSSANPNCGTGTNIKTEVRKVTKTASARAPTRDNTTKISITGVAEQRRVFACGVFLFMLYLLAVSGLFSVMAEWDYGTAFYFLFNSVALIGFGDVFPSDARIILVNMFFIVLGVVLFSMCYFILQEEIRVKAFEASRRARMSICKYSHSILLHTKNPWSRRNSPAFDLPRSSYSRKDSRESTTGAGSAFSRMRKRRQSAPVITLQSESRKASRAEILFDGGRESGVKGEDERALENSQNLTSQS